MPQNSDDNKPAVRQEASKMPSNTSSDDAEEVSSAADQLASMTVTDDDGAGSVPVEQVMDPELFTPHSPREDCPVCLVPLQITGDRASYWACCGKMVCSACVGENRRALNVTNMKKKKKKLPPLETTCAFCRTPSSKDNAELIERYEKRILKGNAFAVFNLGRKYVNGDNGLPMDEAKGLELLQRAADLGFAEALSALGTLYSFGEDGEDGVVKNEKKGREFLELAVRKGNVHARHSLGILEETNGNIDLAIRHWRLAAEAGDGRSVKQLWNCFFKGKLSKADLEKTLRGHQDALNEMNSEDRERYAAGVEALAGKDETPKKLYCSYYNGYLNAKELQMALKCNRGGKWNQAELDKIFKAAEARLRASGCI